MRGSARRILVFGVVQGVGFRPFIYRLARRFGFKGWVKNIGAGVEIHVETAKKIDLDRFISAIRQQKPLLASIEKITTERTAFRNLGDFKVRKSRQSESFVFISPDISVCESCREDIADPGGRRYRYPFTNCTDCGPRYTIVKSLPYDRPYTTMSRFTMCPDCAAEYENPLDRRYHAQPIACPQCGPSVELREAKTGNSVPGGIERAVELIRRGKILAVKGLGGFHLMCDPLNSAALGRLRKIKGRRNKPLALMALDVETVLRYAALSAEEKRWLVSVNRPIVLLKKKKDIPGIAPHLDEIGFMLPYTPLHYLLLENLKLIVATSSNKKDAPIMKEADEGIDKLCDFILDHNRPIHMRTDDSVLKIVASAPLLVRRARGYVPYPQPVPEDLASPRHILALGGELKDTISIYKNGYVVTSQFLGDLDEYQNHLYFEETIRHLCRLFDVKPFCVVSDLHPNFHTTRYAQKMAIPHLQVQHHHAHILAVLLERGIPPKTRVLGVSWDGYGYGADGTAWGGEFLLADYQSFQRYAHFQFIPLPGIDLASRQPWRMALAYLRELDPSSLPHLASLKSVSPKKVQAVLNALAHKALSPLSSSCGRLFDAVSSIIGLAPLENEFEAEAAMRLEAASSASAASVGYPYRIIENDPRQISFLETISAILRDIKRRVPHPEIAAKFHNTLARVILQIAQKARKDIGLSTVVLSGGVFLNKRLLTSAASLLGKEGFQVLKPEKYSPNDESISLGQIAFALARFTLDPPTIGSTRKATAHSTHRQIP
jgi:hydrogenase maturation protein HypF